MITIEIKFKDGSKSIQECCLLEFNGLSLTIFYLDKMEKPHLTYKRFFLDQIICVTCSRMIELEKKI